MSVLLFILYFCIFCCSGCNDWFQTTEPIKLKLVAAWTKPCHCSASLNMIHFVLSVYVYVFDILLQEQWIYLKQTSLVWHTQHHIFHRFWKTRSPGFNLLLIFALNLNLRLWGDWVLPRAPFCSPHGSFYPPPSTSTTIQAYMAAGSCAVLWFLLCRHNTCTWQQLIFFCMHARVSLASPTCLMSYRWISQKNYDMVWKLGSEWVNKV